MGRSNVALAARRGWEQLTEAVAETGAERIDVYILAIAFISETYAYDERETPDVDGSEPPVERSER
ncbi:hypothetical protein [Natrarchaeobius oligotrophus]|uniref:Uncharacterized protein n=1 Tax=Natrarchaeobius chitinivorans TaxID=1679083 RepID=A0A3N6MSF6_NATCH|nr:hypothetical protein [Natrarchaeobius chitinivorans]RQH00751.1 hypothetical protein EA472_08905 [Natrarchaeobius chitinivorans]